MAKANGSFEITSFNEDTYEERRDKAKLTHAKATYELDYECG